MFLLSPPGFDVFSQILPKLDKTTQFENFLDRGHKRPIFTQDNFPTDGNG